jgi:hypothetical protein
MKSNLIFIIITVIVATAIIGCHRNKGEWSDHRYDHDRQGEHLR